MKTEHCINKGCGMPHFHCECGLRGTQFKSNFDPEPKPILAEFECVNCGEDAGDQRWLKDEGIICNECETDLYRTYCDDCENYVENNNPCVHRL